jgi:hypothetical protein
MLDAPLMLGTLAIDTNTINVIIANLLFLGCLIFKKFIKLPQTNGILILAPSLFQVSMKLAWNPLCLALQR